MVHEKIYRGEKIRFTCVRCGRCCSTGPNVALTVYDICRIAQYLGVNWRELRGKYIIAYIADMTPVPALRGLPDKCAFLEIENGLPKCKIYPVRPMRCKLYPFLPGSPSNKNYVYYDEKCLGIGVGDPVEPPWKILDKYYDELQRHYRELYSLVFIEGYEPLEALEKLLDKVCKLKIT